MLAYSRDLTCFIAFCESRQIHTWDGVNGKLVRAYITKQHKQGLPGRSLQRYLSSIRQFYRYLTRYHGATDIPTEGIKAPKYKKRLPSTLTLEQLNKLLVTDGEQSSDCLFCRDLAILEVLYGSGLRLAEMVSLDLNDINWHDQVIFEILGTQYLIEILGTQYLNTKFWAKFWEILGTQYLITTQETTGSSHFLLRVKSAYQFIHSTGQDNCRLTGQVNYRLTQPAPYFSIFFHISATKNVARTRPGWCCWAIVLLVNKVCGDYDVLSPQIIMRLSLHMRRLSLIISA